MEEQKQERKLYLTIPFKETREATLEEFSIDAFEWMHDTYTPFKHLNSMGWVVVCARDGTPLLYTWNHGGHEHG